MPEWIQPDTIFEQDADRRDPMLRPQQELQKVFEEALAEPSPKPDPQIPVDLPRRTRYVKTVIMTPAYLAAVHQLLREGKPLRQIQRKFNVSQVALRLHRKGECSCSERGII